MTLHERVVALRNAGLSDKAVAAILDISAEDVVTILNSGEVTLPASGLPDGGEVGDVLTLTAPNVGGWQTFESGEETEADTDWCFFEGSDFNLVSSGAGLRQIDLSTLANNGFRFHGDFSINENGSIVTPTPGLFAVMGGISNIGLDTADGVILSVALQPEVVDTFLPNMPHWPLCPDTIMTLDQATIYGTQISLNGIVALPESQDIGPLKLMIGRSGGWSTVELGFVVRLSLVQLPGTGAYSST